MLKHDLREVILLPLLNTPDASPYPTELLDSDKMDNLPVGSPGVSIEVEDNLLALCR